MYTSILMTYVSERMKTSITHNHNVERVTVYTVHISIVL